MLQCSPSRVKLLNEKKDKSCLLKEDLDDIAEHINKNSIKTIDFKSMNRDQLYKKIKKHFKDICSNEYCWVKKANIKNNNSIFKPEMPIEWYDNPNHWLNNLDIENVLLQYEESHKNFKFLGANPLDFEGYTQYKSCVSVCDFTIKKLLKEKKTCFGMVINYDTHQLSGSHWVSLFCNINPKKEMYGIYFYNSGGTKTLTDIPLPILNFMKRIKEEMNDPRFELRYNKIKRQFKDSECGMFSVVFIIQCLKNIPFNTICKEMFGDAKMNALRTVLFMKTS